MSLWIQPLRTSIRQHSTLATWKTVFRMSSSPFHPNKPIKHLICKPLYIKESYLLKFLFFFIARFSRALWISKAAFCSAEQPCAERPLSQKLCQVCLQHWYTHYVYELSVTSTVTEVTAACTCLLCISAHLNTGVVFQWARPSRHSNIEIRLHRSICRCLH